MKRIIMRIRGGLGNQLFILGYGMYLSEICKTPTKLICDVREYEKYKIRNYELNDLIISDDLDIYDSRTDKRRLLYDLSIKVLHLRLYMNKKLRIKDSSALFWENKFGIVYKTVDLDINCINKENIYLYGYFVDSNPLLKIRDKLIHGFMIKEESLSVAKYAETIRASKHSIAISMRLGSDYKEWYICGSNYYEKAIQLASQNDSVLFVFSDDIDKAREIIKDRTCVFISQCTPSEQLFLMSICDDFIISNSTFSWWGAFLGHSDNRKVYCPEYWHTCMTTESKLFYPNMQIVRSESI